MQTYKLKLKISSFLGTPPAADTIWGHICWAIRYNDGIEALDAFLASYDDGEPPLALSDPFPEGFMPVPALPNFLTDTENQMAYATVKKLSKRSFIATDYLLSRPCLSKRKINAHFFEAKYDEPAMLTKATIAHNSINRITGAVSKPKNGEGSSGLFFTDEYHIDTDNPPVMDMYVLSGYGPGRIEELFKQALSGGYGKYASRGKGRIEVLGIESFAFPAARDANAVMLLTSCMPAPEDPTGGYWQLFTRYGKLGAHFASESLAELGVNENLPFKYPVTMLKAGAVLRTDAPRSYYGMVASGVHSVNKIRHYGIAPAIPINCDFGGEA
ncbi:MAG: hypothetical protein AB7F23_09360 [Phycisphaerae bacterium]|jgi:CRISPR-associated protein Csm4